MIEYQFIPIILIYILIGLAWSDFIHAMIIKSVHKNNWKRSTKFIVLILWPISFLSFLYTLIRTILKTIKD